MAKDHGRLDILVNNAGSTWGSPAHLYPRESWDKVIDVNTTGTSLLSQAAVRHGFLGKGGATILNIASVEGLGGHHPSLPGTVAYNAAKGAIVNLARALDQTP